MRAPFREGEPSKRNLRYFAWIAAICLAIAARQRPAGEQVNWALASAVVFAIGTVLPGALKWPCKLALILLSPLLWLVSAIALLMINIDIRKVLSACRRLLTPTFNSRGKQTTPTLPSRS
jgi:hypothetical protein